MKPSKLTNGSVLPLSVFGILSILLFVVIYFVTANFAEDLLDSGWVLSWGIWMVVFFGYFIYPEGTTGQTLGKGLLGLKVVKRDGSSCTWRASIVRNLLRVVDFLPVAYILGLLTIFETGNDQRIGDLVAGTVVVKSTNQGIQVSTGSGSK